MKKISCLLALSLLIVSCNKSDDDQFEDPNKILDEINLISESVVCNDPSEWEIIRFGNSGCGFANYTRAFHSSINREELQRKLDAFSEADKRRFESRFGEIACLSIARRNLLINNTQFVECVNGENKISIDSSLENKFLLGKWKLSFSLQRVGSGTTEVEDKIIEFSNTGYSLKTNTCDSEGTYGYEELKGVVLSASSCNNSARMYI